MKCSGRRAEESALHVLFVCTGNICRSPTAERLALAYAAEQQIPDFHASSAGTRALVGHPMHEESARVLKKLGGEPSDFAARRLNARVLGGVDLVLALTKSHRDAVLELAPQKLHRAFTLVEASRLASEFHAQTVADLAALRSRLLTDDIADVVDPINKDVGVFAMVGAQIAELLPPILEVCRRSGAS